MVPLKVNFGFKRLCWLLAAFLFGWLSAKTSSQIQSIIRHEKQVELLASTVPLMNENMFLRHFLTEEKCSRQNADRNHSTDAVLYRELLRRRSIKTVTYSRNVVTSNFKKMKEIASSTVDVEHFLVQLKPLISSTEKLLKGSTYYLLANLHEIGGLDDGNICRKEALNRLSDLVQTRIKALQNPPDCTRAKILLVDVDWYGGYACHTHHIMFCLNIAYATKRTLILSLKTDSGKWWSESYMSLSDTCSTDSVSRDDVIVDMNSANYNDGARVMRCTTEFAFHAQNVPIAPPVIPKDLAPFMLTLHGQPAIWFLGQLAQYVMRPRPKFKSQLDRLASSNKLSENHDGPIVGVDVRRTNKAGCYEANLHNLSEYMVHVDRYFDYIDELRSLKSGKIIRPSQRSNGLRVQRQIYLASDDPSVFEDMKVQYPQYIVHSTPEKAFIAFAGDRYPTDSRTRVAMEIFLLSMSDYIVCPLSSHVCRLAYELMQARQGELGDAGDLIQTMDTSYFWEGGQVMTCEMVQNDDSVNLHKGDVVDIWSSNLKCAYENQRLKNKTFFLDSPFNCALRVLTV